MDFPQPISVQELASEFNLHLIGDKEQLANGINEIHKVRLGDITFVDFEKYYKKALESNASIIIINKEVDCPKGKTLLIAEDPFTVYNSLVWKYCPYVPQKGNRGLNIQLGSETIIEEGVFIGHNVIIGNNCYIQSGTYIGDNTIIGSHVIIQAGVLIGTDAFYFKKINGAFTKWRSGGKVVIEDNVDIGAGCTVNRGVSGETIIGNGTKIDSQVHIGHGVVIGSNCLIAAQTGIAGKSKIGNNVTLYGQVGIAQNISIGEGAVVLAKSGVSKDLEGNKTYFGIPVQEAREKYKEIATMKYLLNNQYKGQ